MESNYRPQIARVGAQYLFLDMFAVKKKPFTDLDPNARIPVIVDHNNDGFVLWEVCLPFHSE
jgi:glutathione S-transferase